MLRRRSILLLSLLLAACGPEPPPADLLFTDVAGPPRVIPDAPVTRYELRHVRSWGSDSGPDAFSTVSAIGVRGDDLLAVVDMATCRIMLFDRRNNRREPVHAVAKCGDGPGEFRHVRSVDLVGDTIVLVRVSEPVVQYLAFDGREYRRENFSDQLGELESVQSLKPVPGGRFVLSVSLMPRMAEVRGVSSRPTSVRLLDLATTRVVAEALGPTPVSQANPGPLTEGPELCSLSGRNGDVRVVVMNRWAIEGVILVTEALRQTAHVVLEGDYRTVPFPQPMTGYLPAGLGSSVACTGIGPIFWKREGSLVERRPVTTGGRILLTDWEGVPLLNTRFVAKDSLLYGRAAAAVGDRVFTIDNGTYEHPVVHEFQLVATGAR